MSSHMTQQKGVSKPGFALVCTPSQRHPFPCGMFPYSQQHQQTVNATKILSSYNRDLRVLLIRYITEKSFQDSPLSDPLISQMVSPYLQIFATSQSDSEDALVRVFDLSKAAS